MLIWFRQLALTARVWLSVGVFCFGISILLGYHQNHVFAETALAQKISQPKEVLLQDFDEGLHSNVLNETRLVGEAALDRAVMIDIGQGASPKWVQVVPFYPVCVPAMDEAYQYLTGQSAAEMSESTKSDIARAAHRIEALQDMPMGMLLIEQDTSVDVSVLHNRIGDGIHGPLVAISGSLILADTLREQAVSAFNANNIRLIGDMPMILPYPNGVRATSGPTDDYSALRDTLEWGAVAMIVMGLCNGLGIGVARRPKLASHRRSDVVEPVSALPGAFTQIRTQEDLSQEDARAATATRRVLSRLT